MKSLRQQCGLIAVWMWKSPRTHSSLDQSSAAVIGESHLTLSSPFALGKQGAKRQLALLVMQVRQWCADQSFKGRATFPALAAAQDSRLSERQARRKSTELSSNWVDASRILPAAMLIDVVSLLRAMPYISISVRYSQGVTKNVQIHADFARSSFVRLGRNFRG